MGPTASGKTALAMDWVQQFPFEIVSVDSALIYRDMNIGTAKPIPAELARAPHHLINILDPTEHYSAGQFVKDAHTLIAAIQQRGHIPLLVGGTMLYFKALQQGIANLPEQNPSLRLQLDEKANQIGWPTMHAELMRIDPESAFKIKPTDRQRIQRGLEVFYLTGKTLSSFHSESAPLNDAKNTYISLALFPKDRTLLHQRIAMRTTKMLQQGFIEEVCALREKYALTWTMPSMRAVGYRQVWQYLEGEISQAELPDKILFSTRQYAKRQLTWLKSWHDAHYFDLNDIDALNFFLKEVLN